MKLIIQIPSYNEEETLPLVLSELPREVEGFDSVEWLLIDDGSTDNTVQIAKSFGVHHILRHNVNKGLAKSFFDGLDACLKYGADVIVNIDADHQYNAADIPALVQPVLNNKADIVIGVRPILKVKHFSLFKKFMQILGSFVVSKLSKTNISDVTSGFRAISRDAALRINAFNKFTYSTETIIQAGLMGIPIVTVPIRVNNDLRPSRLTKSTFSYLFRSTKIIIRAFLTYRSDIFLAAISFLLFLSGILYGVSFLRNISGNLSISDIYHLVWIVGIFVTASLALLGALLANLISINRKLLEDIQYKIRLKFYTLEDKRQ